jgi:hypothetical protein
VLAGSRLRLRGGEKIRWFVAQDQSGIRKELTYEERTKRRTAPIPNLPNRSQRCYGCGRERRVPFPPDAPKKIRDKVDAGDLPRDKPRRMYAGFGNGRFCDGCETTILPAQVEYQFETATADERVIRFHLGCVVCGRRTGCELVRRRRSEAATYGPMCCRGRFIVSNLDSRRTRNTSPERRCGPHSGPRERVAGGDWRAPGNRAMTRDEYYST